jgi:hypothetical protein
MRSHAGTMGHPWLASLQAIPNRLQLRKAARRGYRPIACFGASGGRRCRIRSERVSTRRAHRRLVAEADGYAHEPWCRVAEHLGHRTGVGTGELNPLPVGRGVKPPSDTLMGK